MDNRALRLIAQLQAYLRAEQRLRQDEYSVPPFTLFITPATIPLPDEHAVPNSDIGGEWHEGLAALRAAVAEHGRELRLRFLNEFAPTLAPALRREGLIEEWSRELLACTPDTLLMPPEIPGLAMVTLDSDSSVADVREGIDVNERGFDPNAAPVSEEFATEFRGGLIESRAFTARLNGEPAAAGMFNPPYHGVTELVGITTIEQFRGRGLAAYLTAYAARVAFERNVDLVFLSTDNPAARRVYERIGFRHFATLLSFAQPAAG